MRTKTKLKVLMFLIPGIVFGSLGTGKVLELAKAARARELAEALAAAQFADDDSQNRFDDAFASVRPEGALAYQEEKPEPLIIRNKGDFSSVQVNTAEQLYLANAIYGEARDEPREGQIAVGLVVLARVKDHRSDFGFTVRGVTLKYQKTTGRWQFDGMRTTPTEKDEWVKSMELSAALLRGEYSFSPRMQSVRYFYATSPKAYRHGGGAGKSWLVRCTKVIATIGGHRFSAETDHCDKRLTLVARLYLQHVPKNKKVVAR